MPVHWRRQVVRIVLIVLVWWAMAWWGTSGPPQFVDCYEVAHWNGKQFIGTGEWKCLK